MSEQLLDGRYRLADRIGSGGMGEVWRAYDEHLHRDVAVKLLTGIGAGHDPSVAARFVREARAAARLSSPYIVTVHELGTARTAGDAEVPYLVMELLTGRPLDRVIRDDGRPALADTARWTDQMCRALSTAHAADVVHRDMKPANVLVTGGDRDEPEDRTAKVLDFGIARILDGTGSSTTLTVTGSIVGTPAYMSPEQARGDGPVDRRTDLYSLGCILYELVTGRPPFEAPLWHVLLRKHMDEPPLRPSRLRPELTPEWDELILALLAKEPGDRPGSATEVRGMLGTLTGPVPVPPPLDTPRPAPVDAAARTTPEPPRSTPVRPPTRLDQPAMPHETTAPPRPRSGPAVPPQPQSDPARNTEPPLRPPTHPTHPAAATTPQLPGAPHQSWTDTPLPAGRAPGKSEALSVAAVVLVITGLLLPWWAAVVLTAATGAGVHLRNRRRSQAYPGRHL
ncbi:protein kinase [Streptomyces sp. NBC_01613]|uniref:protein kinase domain-containing protein n=1 Tax=Streptomyces sp. NBC_01613 TaxID=2975896 RepID=UPI0038658F47